MNVNGIFVLIRRLSSQILASFLKFRFLGGTKRGTSQRIRGYNKCRNPCSSKYGGEDLNLQASVYGPDLFDDLGAISFNAFFKVYFFGMRKIWLKLQTI
jgi:hypothetical protein